MNELSPSLQHKEQTARLLWTGFILMFFVIQAIVWIVALSLTAGDKSHAVLPDYDRRALNWNEERERRTNSVKLGWQARLLVDDAADIRRNRVVTITLTDRQGQPVRNASLQLRAFHRARAGDPRQLRFREVGPGVYSTVLQVDKPGLWQFEGQAAQGERVFLINRQQSLQVSR
jgi:nitrogen fixation protein FixH